jgi:hypothetical protein
VLLWTLTHRKRVVGAAIGAASVATLVTLALASM